MPALLPHKHWSECLEWVLYTATSQGRRSSCYNNTIYTQLFTPRQQRMKNDKNERIQLKSHFYSKMRTVSTIPYSNPHLLLLLLLLLVCWRDSKVWETYFHYQKTQLLPQYHHHRHKDDDNDSCNCIDPSRSQMWSNWSAWEQPTCLSLASSNLMRHGDDELLQTDQTQLMRTEVGLSENQPPLVLKRDWKEKHSLHSWQYHCDDGDRC